jgi:hypothetical protein
MIASGQNLKRLVTFGRRLPRKKAMVAALRPPEKPTPCPMRRHRLRPARRFSTRWSILRSSNTRSCLDLPLRGARMASKALHAACQLYMLWCWMDMLADEYSGPGHFMCVDRGVPDGVWWRMPGPRLERTHALCEPCVSRTGLSPPVCGRQIRVELHIQDIRPRMLPPSAAPRRQASCTHPCCSFPGSGLRAHSTLHSPGPG